MAEETDVKTEEKQAEEKTGEEKTEEQKPDWNGTRQKLDQYEASLKVVEEQRDAQAEKIDTLTSSLEDEQSARTEIAETLKQVQQQLAATAKAEDVDDIEKLDPDIHGKEVVTVIRKMKAQQDKLQEQLGESQKSVKALQEAKDELVAAREKDKTDADQSARKEKILKRLDGKYGAKFRNDAIKLANKRAKQEGAPIAEEIYPFLEECYEKVKADAPPEKTSEKKTTATDTGAGSVLFKEGEIKEGKAEDVAKQVKAKLRGKGFELPSPD